MPDDGSGDLAARVRVVERELERLREQVAQVALSAADAGAARVLAAGADRDVSEVRAELRAHTQVLNALREDQLSLRAEMGEFRQDMDGFREETRQGFATLNTGMTRIVELLESGDR